MKRSKSEQMSSLSFLNIKVNARIYLKYKSV